MNKRVKKTRRELLKYGVVSLGTITIAGGVYSLRPQGSGLANAKDRYRDDDSDSNSDSDSDNRDDDREPARFTPFTDDLPIPPVVQALTAPFKHYCTVPSFPELLPPKYYEIRMQKAMAQILPVNPPNDPNNPPTEIWGYDGLYPGPTFKVKHNEPAIVRFYNDLDLETIPHNHGGHTPSESDGSASVQPTQLIPKDEFRDFCYPNVAPMDSGGIQDTNDFGSTQWYHDHAPDSTGEAVYRGLAAFYLLKDQVEEDLVSNHVLPAEQFDIPLVIQDRRIATDGSLIYRPEEDEFDGWLGDIFVANGKAQPKFHVQPRKYRFRILNGSNARWYTFRLTNGEDFLQIGSDSWLLEHAVLRNHVRLSPAERADVIIDFTDQMGTDVFLENILRQEDGSGPDDLNDLGPGTPIVKFVVDQSFSGPQDASVTNGSHLRDHTEILASEIVRTRRFVFEREDGRWAINERFFDPNRDDARPTLGTAERWILENDSGGWAHPIHMHLEAHQVQSVNGHPPALYDSFKKDTVQLGPDDEAVVFMKFRTFEGKFVFHCHNLEHEDMAMMAVFNVIT